MTEDEIEFVVRRESMVEEHMLRRGIRGTALLDALRTVPRERFMPPDTRHMAYDDNPVRIGHGQTISQPYVVAVTLQAAQITAGMRVLDVGTGSGYQAALLAELGATVWSVERIAPLADRARSALADTGYDDVQVVHADGAHGLPDAAPFDAIVVAAAPPTVPPALLEQLAPGGRLVLPVGDVAQELEVWTQTPEGPSRSVIFAVRYVPLVPGLQH